jgi:hypothetical protein
VGSLLFAFCPNLVCKSQCCGTGSEQSYDGVSGKRGRESFFMTLCGGLSFFSPSLGRPNSHGVLLCSEFMLGGTRPRLREQTNR